MIRDCGVSGYFHLYFGTQKSRHTVTAGFSGSVGCAVRLETRRSRVQPPSRSATFFRGDWSWIIFYGHSLPPLIQEGQLSVSGKRMCTILVNRLEDYAYPVNVWLGKLTALDMTPLGWLGRKTSTQTNIQSQVISLMKTGGRSPCVDSPLKNKLIICRFYL